MRRGEIYWTALDPTVGSEIRKTRPALVVSNDNNNLQARTVTVLPITSNLARIFPFEALLPAAACGIKEDSKAKADQIRTLDKSRLRKAIGFAPPEVMARADYAMRLHLGLESPTQPGWIHEPSPRYRAKRTVKART
ncbi:MAG: type II toxin-antitoxin system PemK/MazF family toxin [Elusimicrobia bacterium]|nr:type II toxin-antitoxin system PemK/MazF family toxin [Elusimicrobiota bacterium]